MRLRKLLRDLLKPATLKSLVITKADRYHVQGFLLMVCPVEKGEAGRDFEVGLTGNQRGEVTYVLVDGRRLLPRAAKRRASKPSDEKS